MLISIIKTRMVSTQCLTSNSTQLFFQKEKQNLKNALGCSKSLIINNGADLNYQNKNGEYTMPHKQLHSMILSKRETKFEKKCLGLQQVAYNQQRC